MSDIQKINNITIKKSNDTPEDSRYILYAPEGYPITYCRNLTRAIELAVNCNMYNSKNCVMKFTHGEVCKEDAMSKILGVDDMVVYPLMRINDKGERVYVSLGVDLGDSIKDYFSEDLPLEDYIKKYNKDIKEKTGRHYKIYRKILAGIVDNFKQDKGIGTTLQKTQYSSASADFEKYIIQWVILNAKKKELSDLYKELVEFLEKNNLKPYNLLATIDITKVEEAYNKVKSEEEKVQTSGEHKFLYLVYVDVSRNINKYYKMEADAGDSEFTVTWGRIGSDESTTKKYPIELWDEKYREKWSKGYKDNTKFLKTEVQTGDIITRLIQEPSVSDLLKILSESANDTVKRNYILPIEQISKTSVIEAQEQLNELSKIDTDVNKFNYLLVKLYQSIPRQMSNVEDFLAKYPYEFQTILQKEQDLIDVLLTSIQSLESAGTKDQVSLLGSLGITIRPVTKEEGEHLHGKLMSTGDWDIRNALMGTSSKRYRRAWRITNLKTQDRFDKYRHSFSKKKYVKELFHGSKTSNFLSILKNGLIIRPTSTNGSMYGRGLYFADDADKSMGYGSQSYGSRWAHGNADKGYLAVFDVMLGDMYLHTSYDSSLNWDKLQRIAKGKDSVFAKKENTGLRKNEYIIYKESQATIKYLIEYT